MFRSHQFIGENRRQAKCVCLPEKTTGIVITSQPESPLTAANSKEIDKKVNAPVATGPPYPKRKTGRKGPNVKNAPKIGLILGGKL